MYKYFSIENFRGFKSFTVEPLNKINLFTGKNNVGKTALLEALWLHHGYHNPELGLRLRGFRGFDRVKRGEILWDMFTDFDPEKTIKLTSKDQEGQQNTLEITIHEYPVSRVSLLGEHKSEGNGTESLTTETFEQETTTPVESEIRLRYNNSIEAHAYIEPEGIRFKRPPGVKEPSGVYLATRNRRPSETLAERFGDLEITKREKKVIEFLRIIEPRLKSLTVRHMGGGPIIYGDIGLKRLVPLPLMGEGLGRLLNIALAITEAQDGGILLVDEVENGLHYSVMENIWKAIRDLVAEFNVQFFATTHSGECARAAHQIFIDSQQYNFALHRLERVKGEVQAVTYDQEMLEAAFELDVGVR
jgi:AAA15 family ATPase/GTPase